MENTYTFAARSSEKPEQIVTFTLHDHGVSVEPGAPIEQIERLAQSVDEGKSVKDIAMASEDMAWLKPTGASLVERRLDGFELADVDARMNNGSFTLTAWVRAGGLRLVPFVFNMHEVDNPHAASEFVKELAARKDANGHAGRMPGPLRLTTGRHGRRLRSRR
jgi:hypothetical protein